MSLFAVVVIAFILSLDAFAVSISCGIKMGCLIKRKILKIALYFGIFQAVMPLLGWFFGHYIKDYVEAYSAYLAFAIFLLLGLKTLYDTFWEKDEEGDNQEGCQNCKCQNQWCIFNLAVATSIDAFVIGLLFSLKNVPLISSVLIIGVITFMMSIIGTVFGQKIGSKIGKWSGGIAGLILLALAVKSFF